MGGAKSVEQRINDLALINSIYNKMQWEINRSGTSSGKIQCLHIQVGFFEIERLKDFRTYVYTKGWGGILWLVPCSLIWSVMVFHPNMAFGLSFLQENLFTHPVFRTPRYMLSSVQSYHGGMTAGQQHTWQLTMDPHVSRSVSSVQNIFHNI